MQRNQWKLAGEQLLSHWRRSGISQIPVSSPAAIAAAKAWVLANAEGLQDSGDLVESRQETPARKTAELTPHGPSADPTPTISAVAAPAESPKRIAVEAVSDSVPMPKMDMPPGQWQTAPMDFVARQSAFQLLNDQVVACKKCEDIACRRQRTVFGVGPVNARIVMFGEAPGADEDRVGEPFVGMAGQLMDKILAASGLKREEVYIMNSLKCRPPNNRTPVDSEIENCRPYFEAQLETIQPDYIVCWGSIAVRAVLKSTESVGRLRGKFHSFRGAKVLVTYHPAYLLRNPDAKRLTWEDMKMLMREIGIPVPGKA
jgi:uracil-DNA glycosylase family 4